MKIGLCSDHAGLEYKNKTISYLLSKGYEVANYGTDSPESCDYPDFAHALANAVESGEVDAERVMVSETLAEIYAAQELDRRAIEIYEKLILLNPEKSAYFAVLIEKVKEKNR